MTGTAERDNFVYKNPMRSLTVLLVDDYEPFRRLIRSMLEEMPEIQVIGEAFDGLDAVHKAEQLRPDLIFLDIGLPKLNGIQAAQTIVKSVPDSKIVFLSQENSDDVVSEAFRLGAFGYITKIKAATEIKKAIEALRLAKESVPSKLGVA